MKQILGLLISGFLFLSEMLCAGEGASMRVVASIHQRYYLIKRLEGPINVFFQVYELNHKNTLRPHELFRSHKIVDFQDPVVSECVQKMSERQTLDPFRILWEQFLSYKFIDKQEFARETLILLLSLYKDLLAGFMSDMVVLRSNQPELSKLLAQHHTIGDIDPVMNTHDIYDSFMSIVTLIESTNTCDFVINNNMRFYHIQRLLRPMYILSRYQYNIKEFGSICTQFKHDRIRQCALLLEGASSIKPLFKLWQCFVSYDFIEDDDMLQEFIHLIICVYSHLEIEDKGQKIPFFPDLSKASALYKKPDAQTVIQIYQVLHSIPILALLDLLDDVVDQFDSFSNQYELHNKELSWAEWVKQYWWSAPVMVSKFILILLRHAKALGLITRNTDGVIA